MDDQIYFTYEDGRSALASLEMNGREIDGVPMSVALQSSEAISKTDPSINSLITLGYEDDDNKTDEHGFALCDLLTYSQRRNTRSDSILLPEKVNEQVDFMDDDESDVRSVEDGLDEESDSDELSEEDSKDILLKRQQEMIDSDEEEADDAAQVPFEKTTPERPSLPPQRPVNPPKRPSAPPQRSSTVSKPPRPSSVAVKPYLEQKKIPDKVVPEREVVLKSQASFTEFDPLQNRPDKSKPERPSRPKQPPVKPPPPRAVVKKDEMPREESGNAKKCYAKGVVNAVCCTLLVCCHCGLLFLVICSQSSCRAIRKFSFGALLCLILLPTRRNFSRKHLFSIELRSWIRSAVKIFAQALFLAQ